MARENNPTTRVTEVVYEPLDVENYEFRILTILPGLPTSTVRCNLTKASLIRPGDFAALSSCWGDPNAKDSIVINGTSAEVTVNLRDALLQLRSMGIGQIWADAVCINQADRQERSL